MASSDAIPRIAIIGGGLSGLVAAFYLRRQFSDGNIVVFEADSKLGGVIQTERKDGYLLEYGADSFSVNPPAALELCNDLELEDRLIEPNQNHRRAFILHNEKPVPVPEGFALLRPTDLRKVLQSSLFTFRGRLRILAERFVAAKGDEADESLEQFAIRRFGREAFDRLIQPLVAGIYTADASQLSMQATMAQFVELERKYGGMIRATKALRKKSTDDAARGASGARYGQFRSFPGGMIELFDRLVDRIGEDSIWTDSRVLSIAKEHGHWIVTNDEGTVDRFDAVVVATGAPVASRLLSEVTPQAAATLGQIGYASSALVLMGAREDQVSHPLDGFGLVVPMIERQKIIAASFSNRKFPGRAPEGHHLIRVFLGGAMQAEVLEQSDEAIIEIAAESLRKTIGLSESPQLTAIQRWNQAMPQYHVGHLERARVVEAALDDLPGLALAGNALRGVGIAHCVASARAAAQSIGDYLA